MLYAELSDAIHQLLGPRPVSKRWEAQSARRASDLLRLKPFQGFPEGGRVVDAFPLVEVHPHHGGAVDPVDTSS